MNSLGAGCGVPGAGLRGVLIGALIACASVALSKPVAAQSDAERHDAGRFTVLAYPSDRVLARSLLAEAQRNDSFPGLARPAHRIVIALAPDDARFAEWVGDAFPEWGLAAAFPDQQRIVMRGRRASSDASNPLVVLRHELAHLALAEALGDLAPRWFNEGYASYAAGEWGREEILATNVALALRGPNTFAELEEAFAGGRTRATAAYALAHRAVAELASLDQARGLSLFFTYWRDTGSMDAAVRRAYGITLDAFQDRWRTRTRRRYGLLAIATDVTIGAGVVLLIVLPMYISRRRRQRRRLETLRNNEAEQEKRARESALDALLSKGNSDRDRTLLDTPSDDL